MLSDLPRTIRLSIKTAPMLAVGALLCTVALGLLPAAIAWTGRLIVDGVVGVADGAAAPILTLLALEGGMVLLRQGALHGRELSVSLLRARLTDTIGRLVLEKADQLPLLRLEDSQFHDALLQIRRGAAERPAALLQRSASLLQRALTVLSYGGLLMMFSPLAVLLLLLAALPMFFAEARFAGEAFRLFVSRSPEQRERMYLEMMLSRAEYAREARLLGLGKEIIARHSNLFERLYKEDSALIRQRSRWAVSLSGLASVALYCACAWIVLETIRGTLSVGEMTMYLLIFKQGQSTISAMLITASELYADLLYLRTLYAFLDADDAEDSGPQTKGTCAGDGLRFEAVCFSYPGAEAAALTDVTLHLPPGTRLALVGENGSGKTTLVKLLTGLYTPTSGRITLDGTDLRQWDRKALRARIGVTFQDFARYQITAGENIGIGDVHRLWDRSGWNTAAENAEAQPVIDSLPNGYDTRLGSWFPGSRDLSMGQWQKLALARTLFRTKADILVLDEPTAAMDASAEARIFNRFQELTAGKTAVLISHRFSTVRAADHIIVLQHGRLLESGDHSALLSAGGHYAQMFNAQAGGYR